MLTVVAKQPELDRPGVVLFVDDERRVLTSMRAMFRRGYTVLTAGSAAEGLELIRSQPVDVVVSDQRMPEMTGVEMLAEIRQCSPHTMRILLTGYADLEAIEASINDCEVFRYLMKPCPPTQLREAVSQALTAARAALLEDPEAAAAVAARAAQVDAVVSPSADVVLLHQSPATAPAAIEQLTPRNNARRQDESKVVAPQGQGDTQEQVDVLVFSGDQHLRDAIAEAAQTTVATTSIHYASDMNQALEQLASHPIGVLITDMAISEQDVTALTAALKQQVPALVTILAAQRSDASLLIDLINHGQVFRFLLKPVPVGQCRLWLSSARKRHLELAGSAAERLRYQPQPLATREDEELLASASGQVADAAGAGDSPSNASDFSAVGIRESIGRQLANLKQRFNQWSTRNG